MSLTPEARARLEELIAGFMDGALTPPEEQEFAKLLADPEARKLYYAQSALHGMLHWERSTTAQPTVHLARPQRSRMIPLAAAAMVLLALGAVIVYHSMYPSGSGLDGRMLQPDKFASLMLADNAVWTDANSPSAVGTRFGAGTLRLKSGSVVIAFDNGAQVVVKGPATFELERPAETALQSGSALVSAAKDTKFSVRNQATLCSYRDGPFGIVASEKGEGEVHALGGNVDIKTPAQQQVLAAGSSVAFDSRGLRGDVATAQAQEFKEALALLKNIAQGNKSVPQGGGNNLLIGWDFRETIVFHPGGDLTVTPTQNHPANASHDVPGVRGSFYHTTSGWDSGAHDHSWTTSIMNSTTNFAYITLNVNAQSVTLTGLQLSVAANDPLAYSVNVEISPKDAKGPVGDNFTLLGTFTPHRIARAISAYAGTMTLQPGTYYIRFRPETTPTVTTSWMWFEYVVLRGTAQYTEPIPATDF